MYKENGKIANRYILSDRTFVDYFVTFFTIQIRLRHFSLHFLAGLFISFFIFYKKNYLNNDVVTAK